MGALGAALPVNGNGGPAHGAGGVGDQKEDDVGEGGGGHPAARVRVRHGGAVLGRVEGAGKDAIHPDASIPMLLGQALGEPDAHGLGGAVGGHVTLAFQGGPGGHVDDGAAARRQEVGDDGAAGIEDGTCIEVHHLVPIRVRGLVEGRPHGEAAGDIGQDVDATEARHDGGDGLFHPLGSDEIDGEGRVLATHQARARGL